MEYGIETWEVDKNTRMPFSIDFHFRLNAKSCLEYKLVCQKDQIFKSVNKKKTMLCNFLNTSS